jgi:NADPH:quinone reductase-like Zn-dependent oxidoreductase/thioesterase domain-containing protein/NADP-dependent 3-hydroxy acid dehydrogenase YdfG
VSRVIIKKPLALVGEAVRTVQVALKPEEGTPEDGGAFTFRMFSRAAGTGGAEWTEHAVGRITSDSRPAPARRRAFEGLPEESGAVGLYYGRIEKSGTALSGPFLNLERLVEDEASRSVVGHVQLPEGLPTSGYGAHPALVDGALQVLCSLIPDFGYDDDTHVPVAVGRYRLFQAERKDVWCEATAEGDEEWNHVSGTVRAYDAEGQPVFEIEGVELQRVDAAAVRSAIRPPSSEWAYEVAWDAVDAPPLPTTLEGRWLVAAPSEADGQAWTAALRSAGAACERLPLPSDQPRPDLSLLDGGTGGEDAPPSGLVYVAAAANGYDDPAPATDPIRGLFHLLQALADRPIPLVVVTRGAVPGAAPGEGAAVPTQAAVWGLCRTARAEHPELRLRTLDLPAAKGSEDEATLVAHALTRADYESETALRDERHLRPRLRRHTGAAWTWTEDAPYRLDIEQRGSLDRLALVPAPRRAPGPDEVEIRVQATGLNFRDVLNALGMYPGDPGPLGGECAGRVTAVGENVSHLAVGDEVVALANGAFQAYVTVPAPFAVRRPAALSAAKGATLPIPFLTAHHGLHRIARLQAGQRVLIHSAAGGVGMAAVQLALRAGAEVFGTAGNPQKRAAVRALGVEHVYDSRSTDFAAEIDAVTGGEGVDVVLNALVGPFIPAGLGLLRAGGYFLELGKRELWAPEQVEAVRPGVRYVPYDLGDVMRDAPADILEMLTAVASAVEEGDLKALPVTSFAIREAHEAFRYMAQARHTGKVVVVHPPAVGPERALVSTDGSYLVTGGLGGLGLRLAERLVSWGARHLVLVGRRAPSAEAQAVLEALGAQGATVRAASADVSDPDDVDALIAEVQATMPPLRGVFHAAGVLEDALLSRQDWPQVARVLAPKLSGAHHLDRATSGLALDHFVLFSSIAAVLGPAGQGAYAAANASLDALAARRRDEGKPALSVNWGPWEEVGMAASLGSRYRAEMSRAGLDPIPLDDGFDVLERLMQAARTGATPPAVVVEPFAWQRMDPATSAPILRPSILEARGTTRASRGTEPGAETGAAMVRALEVAGAEERARLVLADLQARIGRVTGASEDGVPTGQPLTALGLESLMAVEFKSQVETAYGVPLTVAMLLRGATLEDVAYHVVRERFGAGEEPAAEPLGVGEDEAAPREPVSAGRIGAASPGAVLLQEGTGVPLFLVPGAGGGAMQFYTLLRYLDPSRTAYALEPRREGGDDGADTTVPHLVAHALDALLSVQPKGPYALAGYSTGGIVAYELANELVRRGEAVALTALLDTVNVWAVAKAKFGLRRGLAAARELGIREVARQVKRTARAARAGTLPEGDGRYGPADLPERLTRDELFSLQRGAFLRHRPSRSTGPVVVLRTDDHPDYVPEDLGWGEVVKRGIDLHALPGNHLDLLSEPSAAAVAAALRPYLDALPGSARPIASGDS